MGPLVLLILLLGAAMMVWLIASFGSRGLTRVPGPDPGGHFPNSRSDLLPSPFNPGTPPLPDIEIADHMSTPAAAAPREAVEGKPKEN